MAITPDRAMASRDESNGVSFAELCSYIQHPYRRRVLVDLLDGEPVPSAGSEAPRAAIHHVHLPKLHAGDLIRWASDRAEIHRGPRYAQVAPFLRLMEAHAHTLPQEWV